MVISLWVDIEEDNPLDPEVVADMVYEFINEQFNPASLDVEFMLNESEGIIGGSDTNSDGTGFYK